MHNAAAAWCMPFCRRSPGDLEDEMPSASNTLIGSPSGAKNRTIYSEIGWSVVMSVDDM